MKSFKQYITESEGIYDSMRSSIIDRLRYDHRKRHDAGQISEPELRREHIGQYRLHNSLLDEVPGRTKIEYADFDEGTRQAHNSRLFTQPIGARRIYKFYIPRQGHPTKWGRHVAVTIGEHLPESLRPPGTHEISFSIDGLESNDGSIGEMDFDTHKAVYSGVMDAVAHHHFDTGTDPENYEFAAVDINHSKTKAKARRYTDITRVLRSPT